MNPYKEILDFNSISNFNLNDENKFQVILNKYTQYWNGMIEWKENAYNTTRWFSTILLALFGYLISHENEFALQVRVVISILITIFGILTLSYLHICKKSFYENYSMSIYCEVILNMYKKNEYIENQQLFPTQFKKVDKVKKLVTLQVIHIAMLITSFVGCYLV